MQTVLVQAVSLGKGGRTGSGNVMLNAMGGMRGRNFRRENGGVGSKERVELRRTSLARGEQWRRIRIGGGLKKQQLEGRGEQDLTVVSINKEVMSSQEIST